MRSSALSDLKNWEKYPGPVKTYFEGTWEPQMKRWCLFYRPNDLFCCNTNGHNLTEQLFTSIEPLDKDKFRNHDDSWKTVYLLQGNSGSFFHYYNVSREDANKLKIIKEGFKIEKNVEQCQERWQILSVKMIQEELVKFLSQSTPSASGSMASHTKI